MNKPQPENVLVCIAWPYANSDIHQGNVTGSHLPGDIYARYHRLRGNRVVMVSGSDSHGTPVTVKAEEMGCSSLETYEHYHARFLELFRRLGISYDLFTSTHTENHFRVSQDMFRQLLKNGYLYPKVTPQMYSPEAGQFLPDRYVEGTCPVSYTHLDVYKRQELHKALPHRPRRAQHTHRYLIHCRSPFEGRAHAKAQRSKGRQERTSLLCVLCSLCDLCVSVFPSIPVSLSQKQKRRHPHGATASRFHPILAGLRPRSLSADNGACRVALLAARALGQPLPGGFRRAHRWRGFQPMATASLSRSLRVLVPVNDFAY